MPHGCLALTPLASVLFHANVSPGLVLNEWEPSDRWWCDPIPCSQVAADAAGTFLVGAKEGLKRKRLEGGRRPPQERGERSARRSACASTIRVVREAARRQLGWDMNVRDRSNDYCTDLVGAWAGPGRIMSKIGP